ncbi:MAG: hypothetical protein QRY71_02520 [Candidatus Rhabdochlamydia sp.]
MMNYVYFTLLMVLCSCSSRMSAPESLTSIQLLDRNGFSETISIKDRLALYETNNFEEPQPYQKVTRVYGKASHGKTTSKITTYHTNGLLWQYLEITSGRAHGNYQEWHPNGQLKIQAYVIEGTPDLSEVAQMTWVFEGDSLVFDEEGHLLARIPYQQGKLEGISTYYFPSSRIQKEIPYHNHEIHGLLKVYDQEGSCLEKTSYVSGLKHGPSLIYSPLGDLQSEELYEKGLLSQGSYFSSLGVLSTAVQKGEGVKSLYQEGKLISEITYHQGKIEGVIKEFDSEGRAIHLYTLKNGLKEGEEWFYTLINQELYPKLMITWRQNKLSGPTLTWHINGKMESQREFFNNQKQGSAFAWFKEGPLMLMEEYQDNLLIKGSYFNPLDPDPVSTVEKGCGIVTLFDESGHITHQISYEKGVPQRDP